MSEENTALSTSAANDNENALVPYQKFRYEFSLPDGSTVSVSPGETASKTAGSYGAALPRLAAGQPRDARFEDGSGQIFMIVKARTMDEQTGKIVTAFEYVGPFGETLMVRPVGFVQTRSLMPDYSSTPEEERGKPLCHSERYYIPDEQYAGVYSRQCCDFNNPRNILCPMAKWVDAKGNDIKARCQEQYVLCVVFPYNDEWVTAEVYFKSTSAPSGRALIAMIGELEKRGLPPYSFPVKLKLVPTKGQGNTIIGVIQMPPKGQEEKVFPHDESIPALETAMRDWHTVAMPVRADRAIRILSDETEESDTSSALSAADMMDGNEAEQDVTDIDVTDLGQEAARKAFFTECKKRYGLTLKQVTTILKENGITTLAGVDRATAATLIATAVAPEADLSKDEMPF